MNLQQLNEKYHGRPIDFRSWKFPTYGAPPNMGFGFEAQFSDGKVYGVKGKIVVEGMETPSQIRGGKRMFGSLIDARIVDAYERQQTLKAAEKEKGQDTTLPSDSLGNEMPEGDGDCSAH